LAPIQNVEYEVMGYAVQNWDTVWKRKWNISVDSSLITATAKEGMQSEITRNHASIRDIYITLHLKPRKSKPGSIKGVTLHQYNMYWYNT